jgi:hypothetical protein
MAATNGQNSFKKLQEEEEKDFPHPPPQVERNVIGNARNIKFMGNVVELYFSRFLDMIVSIIGGNTTRRQENKDVGEPDVDMHKSPEGRSKNDNNINP